MKVVVENYIIESKSSEYVIRDMKVKRNAFGKEYFKIVAHCGNLDIATRFVSNKIVHKSSTVEEAIKGLERLQDLVQTISFKGDVE